MQNTREVTLREVAIAAGVSKATAAFACAGTGTLSAPTRERVLGIAREMGYQPNPHAQRMRGRGNDTIALFSLALDRGSGVEKLALIQRQLCEAGYEVPLHGYGYIRVEDTKLQTALLSSLRRQKPRAIVVNSYTLCPQALTELERYQNEGGIVISYDNPDTIDCDSVVFDRADSMFRAATHLIQLGHQRIGLAMAGFYLNSTNSRLEGLRRALDVAGLREAEECLFNIATYEMGGVQLAAQFLQLPPQLRPTALCIVNDMAAVTFLSEVMRAGVRIPHDLSVISLDNSPLAQHFVVPLTGVIHPIPEIATQVVTTLLERLRDPSAPRQTHVLRGELQMRDSSAAPTIPLEV